MKEVDYIIVGQGLAGSCLALSLLKEKQSVHVFSSAEKKASSEVAAGLYNPITGKKMVVTWNAEKLFPFLEAFYKNLESEFNTRIIYPKKIFRPFHDVQAQTDFWTKHSKEMEPFAMPEKSSPAYEPYIHNPFGGIATKQSGYVDVSAFLACTKNKLDELNSIQEDLFEYNGLSFNNGKVQYKNIEARKIIFAEGYYSLYNPYFNWVPIKGMKGDVLTIKIQDYPIEDVINKHFFIIPLANGNHRIGSSYIREFSDDLPTEKGLNEIMTGADTILKKPFVLIDHKAGIRPTIVGHRPVIGTHPKQPLALIFNGLGTKGVSIAPFVAQELTKFLVFDQEIDQSLSVNRFYYLYS